MKVIKLLRVVAVMVSLSAVSVAHAGPQVRITFRNNSDTTAAYDVAGSSAYSYAEASPKPLPHVEPRSSDVFNVAGGLTADVTSAIFQYRIGRKVCKFKTSYLKTPGRGAIPKWSKSADASGGARCDVKVTYADPRTHDWAVEFTMR